MAMNQDIDTSDLIRVERIPISGGPALDTQSKSPFYVSQVPTTSIVNPDAVRNFHTPTLPTFRITPPLPLTLSGAASNTIASARTASLSAPQPPAPIVSQTLVSTPTGYQFGFQQVKLPASLPPSAAITLYKVYRNTSNTTGGAIVIDTIPHNPANVGDPIVVQDAVPSLNNRAYWVSAVNASGVESTLTPAQSGIVQNTSALNATNQLNSSFNNIPLNVSYVPTSTTVLSNSGGLTPITVASSSVQFGGGLVPYNSATLAPGSFGTSYVVAFDPHFQGGSAVYLQSSTPAFQADDTVVGFGKIVTVSGTPSTGGGSTGGTTPNGAALRGINI